MRGVECTVVGLLVGLTLWCNSATAAPYAPVADAEVLERLPIAAVDPASRRLNDLQAQLKEQPADVGRAVKVAELFIAQGRSSGDPRFYGYAQAALQAWWERPDPPLAVRVLRATIRQHDHDFTAALADLDAAVAIDPNHAQAWLTRAVVLQVRGELTQAKESCLHLLQVAPPLVTSTCINNADSLRGQGQRSYQALRRMLSQTAGSADNQARAWALTVLAEIAARNGDGGAAEAHFRQALEVSPGDTYLLAAFADFLLDRGRALEVRDLLASRTDIDALLLRLTLAEQQLAAPESDEHVRSLVERFAAARLRGDAVHQREEARFLLSLRHQPGAALELARANWRVQREPSDARLLLEAALAAGDPSAAQPVLDYLRDNRLEDVQLARLLAQLGAA